MYLLLFLFRFNSSKVDETKKRNKVLLLSMKINYEYEGFFDVVEGVASNIFLGAGPQTPFSKAIPIKVDFWHVLFDLMEQTCSIQER